MKTTIQIQPKSDNFSYQSKVLFEIEDDDFTIILDGDRRVAFSIQDMKYLLKITELELTE